MDEEKIKRLREKIAYLRKMGKEGKAMNLERKIEQAAIKKDYKANRTPSKVGKVLRKIKKGVTNAASAVKNEVKETVDTVKKVKEAKVKKDKKPPVVKAVNPQGKPLSSIDKNTSVRKTSLSGTVGLAYGKDGQKGVGSVTKNGKTYKPGDEGFDAAAAELLAQSNKKEETIKRIKKNK